MASHKNRSQPTPQRDWHWVCTGSCGSEQKIVTALVVGAGGRRKRAMCTGCREFLPIGSPTYKK